MSELYQQAIKDLAAKGSERLAVPDASSTLDNPLCGDKVTLDVTTADGRIVALGHVTKGCLLCKAAATVAAEQAPGLPVAQAAALADQVRAMLKGGDAPALAGLEPFLAVRPHKSRHDCVLLPFKALAKALASF
ncbi:iron-sulfur cluster assembly scaffold protein [Paramagnetospirillum kuznetsovii]|uniref:Iron-sulfur cluster assembly scaffold protein n=1 Tax=Paramagnetospirillum kuznetsovii TaxID=2053833 RepID=A0A364NZ86_9PROT|nr:iron-sulfur cluster assembly scaffold protein [Paramagnetospirillum kuznetsovii]RAU22320.1 iron-sulfur cluster assembly scaffold protein [Paramagnetospirillum kuznetsovii]